MTPGAMTFDAACVYGAAVLLGLAFLFAFIRVVIGPALADRVVGLELMSIISIGVICVYCAGTGRPIFIDIAIIVALVSFLATVAFAYYIGRRERVLEETVQTDGAPPPPEEINA